MRTPPLFMTNKDWYRFDDEKGRAVLTKDAPPEAVKSYNDYYREIEEREKSDVEAIVKALAKKYSQPAT
nr:MAG TPA: hypothetical protein [Caudoviricetes sp.]